MKKRQSINPQLHILQDYLKSQNIHFQSIISKVSLKTFVEDCILSSNFVLLSSQKIKFLQAFKHKILSSDILINSILIKQKQLQQNQTKQITQEITKQDIKLSNVVCYINVMIQQKKIFLQNQYQWRIFIDLIFKIVLGKSYQLNLDKNQKYRLLLKYLKLITNSLSVGQTQQLQQRNPLIQITDKKDLQQESAQMINFLSGLKSLGIFKALFLSCSNPANYKYLFELCFIFLSHSYSRKVQQSQQQKKIIDYFLDKFFLQLKITQLNGQFYYKLLKNYNNYFQQQFNIHTTNLYFKVLAQRLIHNYKQKQAFKITQKQKINDDQSKKIANKLQYLMKQMLSNSKFIKYLKGQTQYKSMHKNLEYYLIANVLLNKQFSDIMLDRLEVDFTGANIYKMFETLKIYQNFNTFQLSSAHIDKVLDYLIEVQKKMKTLNQYSLKLANPQVQSYFSMNILMQCKVELQLKINKKQKLIIFQFMTKQKQIIFYQTTIANNKDKNILYSYEEIKSTKRKTNQSKKLFQNHSYKSFVVEFLKSKIKVSIKQNQLNEEILEIQSIKGLQCIFLIGRSTKPLNIYTGVSQIKDITMFKTISKGQKKAQQITGVAALSIIFLYQKKLQKKLIKQQQTQVNKFQIDLKNCEVINYPINFQPIYKQYKVKNILLKTFENLWIKYIRLNSRQQIQFKDKAVQVFKKLIEFINKSQQNSKQQLIKIIFIHFLKEQQKGNSSQQQQKVQEKSMISQSSSQRPINQSIISFNQPPKQTQIVFQNMFQICEQLEVYYTKSFNKINYLNNNQSSTSPLSISWQFLNLSLHPSIQLFYLVLGCLKKYLSRSSPHSIRQINPKQLLSLFQNIILNCVLILSDQRIMQNQKNCMLKKISFIFEGIINCCEQDENISFEGNRIQQLVIFLNRVSRLKIVQSQDNVSLLIHILNFIKFLFKLKLKTGATYSINQFTPNKIIQVCLKNIKNLAVQIQQQQKKIRQYIKNSLQNHFKDSQIFQLNSQLKFQQIQQMSIQQYQSNNEVHKFLKNKIKTFSSYLRLYFSIYKYSKDSKMYTFYIILTNILGNFVDYKVYKPSLLCYQLCNICWNYFINNLQKNQQEVQTKSQEFYQNAEKTIYSLSEFHYDFLSPVTALNIAKKLVFHARLLLIAQINWKFQLRINYINQSKPTWYLQFIKCIAIQISANLTTRMKKQMSKTIAVFTYRTALNTQILFKPQLSYTLISCLVHEDFIKQMIRMLIISRQLSKGQVHTYLTDEQCKSNLKVFIQSLQKYQNKLQTDIKNMQAQNRKQNLPTFQGTIYKINSMIKFLVSYNKTLEQGNDKFNPKLFASCSVCQLIQQHFASLVRTYELQKNKQRKLNAFKAQNQQKSRINSPKLNKIQTHNIFSKLNKQKSQRGFFPQPIIRQQKDKNLIQLSISKQKQINANLILINCIQNQFNKFRYITQSLQSISSCRDSLFVSEDLSDQNYKENIQLIKNPPQQRYQFMIDDYCDSNGLRPLIKTQRIDIKLPKLNEKMPIPFNLKNKILQKQANIDVLNHIGMLKQNSLNIKKQIITHQNYSHVSTLNPARNNLSYRNLEKYKVMYITNTSFYQGQIIVHNNFLCQFIESKQIDQTIYRQIQALNTQKRSKQQVQHKPMNFQMRIHKNLTFYIKKSYLKANNSIEFYSLNKTFFFVFADQRQRDEFTHLIYKKAALNIQTIDIYAVVWKRGGISNFQYLMKLNKFSQRSFNDISQYYVFPWTVKQFKSAQIDENFMKNQDNFRDLSLPIGKINEVKFAKLKSQYDNSKKYFDSDRPLFLYGSFYSNPAIVSYYLLRLFPFSAHQYQLQNSKFDLPDRLFSSIQKNFNAVYNITGDFKQLIPQFYSNPQFLKNRNRYNFGNTQSKQVIDNVQLPEWVITNTPQEFIFRMRKLLESEIVTKSLNKWIDLIFGKYSDKNGAQKYDNLYNQHVYGVSLITQQSRHLSFCIKYLKQFGQIPKRIFEHQHPRSLMKSKQTQKFKNTKSFTDLFKQKLMKQDIKEFTYDQCQKLNEKTEVNKVELKVIQRKNSVKQTQNQQQSSVANSRKSKQFQHKQLNYILIKQNHLISKNPHGVGYYVVNQDSKRVDEYKCTDQLRSIELCQIFTIDNSSNIQTYMISIENKMLMARKFNPNSMVWKNSIGQRFTLQVRQKIKLIKTLGSYLILVDQFDGVKLYTSQQKQVKQIRQKQLLKQQNSLNRPPKQDKIKLQKFTLYNIQTIKISRSQIQGIITNNHLSLVCFYNKQNQFFIYDARQDLTINFRIRFKINTLFDEKIVQVLIHNMGYILILTSHNRLVFLNMLGEIILNVIVNFKKNDKYSTKQKYPIDAVCFWSHQSSDIVFSTNRGTLYKVDLFDMAQKRKAIQKIYNRYSNMNTKQSQTSQIEAPFIQQKQLTINQMSKKECPIQQYQIFQQRNERFYQVYEFQQNQQKIVDMKIQRRGRHWKLYCLGEKGNMFTLKNRYFDITRYMNIIEREMQD